MEHGEKRIKHKYKRRHKPKFTKRYSYTMQDTTELKNLKLLHNTYSEIASELFEIPHNIYGDWTVNVNGLTLFLDPTLGAQAEITGTSNFPLLKRLRIHIRFLNLVRSGKSIVGAIKSCLST